MCLAVDAEQPILRVAVGTRDQGVMLWKLDEQDRLENVFSVQLGSTMAAAVSFHHAVGEILVFGRDDGEV